LVGAAETTKVYSLITIDITQRAQLNYLVRCIPLVETPAVERPDLGHEGVRVWTKMDHEFYHVIFESKIHAEVFLRAKLESNIAVDGKKANWRFTLKDRHEIKLRVIDPCDPVSLTLNCAYKLI
jgi:hypothetical protein